MKYCYEYCTRTDLDSVKECFCVAPRSLSLGPRLMASPLRVETCSTGSRAVLPRADCTVLVRYSYSSDYCILIVSGMIVASRVAALLNWYVPVL